LRGVTDSVVTPERIRWRVGRRWLPFRVRLRGGDWRDFGPTDLTDAAIFESPAGILAGLAVVATAMLLFLVVWPVVAVALELVIIVFVLLLAVTGRVVLRRPWTVYAASVTGEATREHTWSVVGWRSSGRLIQQVKDALERGTELPVGAVTDGPEPKPLPRPEGVPR
jgi:hypothetical protein